MLKQLYLLLLSTALCSAALKQSLNGQWTLNGNGESFAATVPGGVFSDLMAANSIGSIYYGYGDANYSWIGEADWTYNTTITVEEDLLNSRVVFLVFEGLDTFATVSVNDVEVGTSENMHVRYVFNVKDQLKVGSNDISVKFTSAVTKAAALAEDPSNTYVVPPECPDSAYHGICHANRIRKMQASFSWDWGPAFASAGIWKDVYLQAFDDAVIDYVVVTPLKNGDAWTLEVNTYLNAGGSDSLSGVIELSLGSVTSHAVSVHASLNEYNELLVSTSLEVLSDQINLWWPNGFGTQELYDLKVAFVGENERDEQTVRVGFKTVELVQDQLDNGSTFYLKINDVPIFAKGSNEIPIDILPERGQDFDTVKFLLQSARDVHMNMLRVWGGGVYESEDFYDLADEYGLLIWQDFMFACAMYPTDDAYLENVRAEIRHQLKRMAGHTSLALLSGNNENEGALRDNWYNTGNDFDKYHEDYVTLYVDTIGKEVARILPHINFVTSSPTNGLKSIEEGYVSSWPGNPAYGDIHFYDYQSDSWDPNTFLIPRFCSEYGYQSMPSVDSWKSATDNLDDVHPDSNFMSMRQHHPNGNNENLALIDKQLQMPDSSSSNYVQAYIYYSQILQAQSIKAQTEHYRSFKGRYNDQGLGNTMGALYWQLNDVWVAPTWSGIEFTRRWKMLHYFAQDFFSPSIVTARFPSDEQLEIYAVLDDLQAPSSDVITLLHIYKWSSLTPVTSIEYPTTLDTQKAVLVTTADAKTLLTESGCGDDYSEAKKNCFFHLQLVDYNNRVIAPANYAFPEKLKNSALADANVQIDSVTGTDEEGREYDIVVSTDSVAAFVWLDGHDIIGRFSENGFLDVSATKTVHFIADEPTTVDDLTAALTVTHVKDAAYL